MGETITIHNRVFNSEDIDSIGHLISSEGHRGRTYISKKLCELWDWRGPNGQLRDITCRDILRQLEARGLIQLPPRLRAARRPGYKNKMHLPSELDKTPIQCSLSELGSITIEMIRGSSKEGLYNGLIGTFHYLGYNQGSGEQLKYLITCNGRLLGCIGFGGSAFKIAPRDTFIGWDDRTRVANLSKVVNNNRFLILPWVRVKNLASHILGCVSRRIREDWQAYYQRDIVLLETFVERGRFLGTCYKATNWLYLGQTQGRGRNDRENRYSVAVKDIYVYPLVKHFRQLLRGNGTERA